MSEVIVITSGKGGVGKTTATANIGMGLARMKKRTVVIDTDIGLRNLDVVLGLENRIVYNMVDVIEGNCRLKQALIKDKRCPELSLLPSAQTRDTSAVTPEQMIKLTEDRIRPDMVRRGEMMSVEDVVEILAVNLIGAVPDDEEVVIFTNQGEPLAGDDTPAGQAFFNVCRRILGEEVPLMELDRTPGFLSRISELFHRNR